MLTNRIVRAFGRLVKPKINRYQNVFEILRDQNQQISSIHQVNRSIFNRDKNFTPSQALQQDLQISEETSAQVCQRTTQAVAYSPSMKPYRISQKLDGSIKIDDMTDTLEGLYSPDESHLKFHYSINQDMPLIPVCEPSETRAYLFNLPEGVTEKEITMEIGYRFIKSVQIKYCMLGLPAYAIIDFNSQNQLTEKAMSHELDISLHNRYCPLITRMDQQKLLLSHRQLVLHNVDEDETPAQMLKFLSSFGRVMHLDLPLQIYREQSLLQIKQQFKNVENPVQINYHKLDGTIESEYYPPYKPIQELQPSEQKYLQYQRRLRYCQQIHIYEGKQDNISVKARGFCTVTFSCQEEAQNCYFQLSKVKKIELKNEREDFEFDKKHREALLRHIDNGYIEHCKRNNPSKENDQYEKKLNSVFFQSFYLTMVHEKFKEENFNEGNIIPAIMDKTENYLVIQMHHNYRTALQTLYESIGQEESPNSPITNTPGKSFDELAEEELYGRKLSKSPKKRYEVNIDDYIREAPEKSLAPQTDKTNEDEEKERDELPQMKEDSLNPAADQLAGQSIFSGETDNEYQGKRRFATFKPQQQSRPKTLQERARSHMRYNEFVRSVINEYMGIFSSEKLESQFYRQKPTLANLQNLKLMDGSDFLPEKDVKNALEFSSKNSQTIYSAFVKENEVVKSLNIDLEEKYLKNLQDNMTIMLQQLTDVGMVQQQFEYTGEEDIQKVVENLNKHQATIGEEFQCVGEENGKKKMVKLAKIESLAPLDTFDKINKQVQKFQISEEYDEKKYQLVEKHIDAIMSGQPLPKELAECFGMQAGDVVDLQKVAEELSNQIGLSRKDFEKIVNLDNYSQEQFNADVSRQLQISEIRKQKSKKKATDYNRDPSEIKTKRQDGKYVVSKFRQM